MARERMTPVCCTERENTPAHSRRDRNRNDDRGFGPATGGAHSPAPGPSFACPIEFKILLLPLRKRAAKFRLVRVGTSQLKLIPSYAVEQRGGVMEPPGCRAGRGDRVQRS